MVVRHTSNIKLFCSGDVLAHLHSRSMEKSEFEPQPAVAAKSRVSKAWDAVSGVALAPHPLVRYASDKIWPQRFAGLPVAEEETSAKPKSKTRKVALAVACSVLVWWTLQEPTAAPLCAGCTQVPPITPSVNTSTAWEAKDRIIEWHQGAIRIPTQVWDEMGAPGEDTRWEVFSKFHEYLESSYPLVHEHLTKTTVDTWGLVFEWAPEEANDRKPIFIAGHQGWCFMTTLTPDVVPVLPETVHQWEHPPFAADYDGKYIWGRGAADDKSTLTSVLGAIEILLEGGWKPSRRFVLGFGHDEERGGMRGAPAIRDFLLAKYGKDSMAILLDEGSGIEESWGRTFGLPSVAEKGKYDLNVTVSTLGGHSSVPPVHTGIGLASLLVTQLERHPYPALLDDDAPIWGFLQCAATYSPDMPKGLLKAVKHAKASRKAFKNLPEAVIKYGLGEEAEPGQGNRARATISTTQAVDMINGGFKVNALPEVVTFIVNHRINIPIAELKKRVFHTLLPVAKEYNLALEGFGFSHSPKHSSGTVFISGADFSDELEPSPISSSASDDPAWRLLAGTARGVWASRQGKKDELIMSPFYGAGNTDTRRYWDLTTNIYRWAFLTGDSAQGGHTVNERIDADALVEYHRFFQAFIVNADASHDL